MLSEIKKAIDTHKLRTPACSAHKGEQVRNPIESKRARETHFLLSTDRGTLSCQVKRGKSQDQEKVREQEAHTHWGKSEHQEKGRE
jgi:hypothetical protein